MNYKEYSKKLRKQAGIYTEYAKSLPGAMLLPAVGLAGEVVGSAVSKPGKVAPDSKAINFVPGIGQYNISRDRERALAGAGAKHPGALALSEALSPFVSMLIYGAIGAGLGGAVGGIAGGKDKAKQMARSWGMEGAQVGALTSVGGALAALLTRRRSHEGMQNYATDNRNIVRNLFAPGEGTYNYYKTLGRIHGDQKEAEKLLKMLNK